MFNTYLARRRKQRVIHLVFKIRKFVICTTQKHTAFYEEDVYQNKKEESFHLDQVTLMRTSVCETKLGRWKKPICPFKSPPDANICKPCESVHVATVERSVQAAANEMILKINVKIKK